MSDWILKNRKYDQELMKNLQVNNLLAKIFSNRNITEESEIKMILSNSLSDMNDEKLLSDIDKAAEFIKSEIEKKHHIRIVGDYDVDGICATYILYDSLKTLGANVSFSIPDRVKDGYGINRAIIDKCIEDKVDTIITCDNGIAASNEISYAKENGIEVVVTDHHDILELPEDAYAVVNPKREDVKSKYPFRNICGAVVAWKFVKYLFSKYNEHKMRAPQAFAPNYEKYLDFAALATVGDIMPLVNENHIIVKLGLKAIKNTKNKGLKKLIELGGLAGREITVYSVGFVICPMINASGRLKTADLALELFLSDDDSEIDKIGNELKSLNDERKEATDRGEEKAIALVEEKFSNDKVLVLYIDNISESVAGIVAGRVKDKFNKPTIVLTDSAEENILKASARSIEAYDMFSALSKHSDMFVRFGGHKLAAGFSIEKDKLEELRNLLNEESGLTEDDFVKKIYIDAELDLKYLSVDMLNELSKLEPYGQDFEKPLFGLRDVGFKVTNIYGSNNNVIKLILNKNNVNMPAVYFYNSEIFLEDVKNVENFNILFYPTINDFNNRRTVEINIKEYKHK